MNDLKLNLDKIKAREPKVYDQLVGALALAGFHIFDGRSEVTLNESQWRKLSELHGELIPVLQAIVNEHEKYCGCNDCFNKRVTEQMGSEKDRLALAAQAKPSGCSCTLMVESLDLDASAITSRTVSSGRNSKRSCPRTLCSLPG